ncbi:NADH-quinone oxidoreductase subunit C, partial [Aeromonas hydrophila]
MKLTREFPSNYAMAQWQPSDHKDAQVIGELFAHFGAERFTIQNTRTGVPVVWLSRELLLDVMGFLRKLPSPFVMLFDLSATDERMRSHRHDLPDSDFTVFYHLISIDRNADLMLKVPLKEGDLTLPTISRHFPNANWYEREVWDLMGINFDGHPHLTRIMMPKSWQGHPL